MPQHLSCASFDRHGGTNPARELAQPNRFFHAGRACCAVWAALVPPWFPSFRFLLVSSMLPAVVNRHGASGEVRSSGDIRWFCGCPCELDSSVGTCDRCSCAHLPAFPSLGYWSHAGPSTPEQAPAVKEDRCICVSKHCNGDSNASLSVDTASRASQLVSRFTSVESAQQKRCRDQFHRKDSRASCEQARGNTFPFLW